MSEIETRKKKEANILLMSTLFLTEKHVKMSIQSSN